MNFNYFSFPILNCITKSTFWYCSPDHARKNGLNSNTLYGFQKWQVKPIYQILVFQFFQNIINCVPMFAKSLCSQEFDRSKGTQEFYCAIDTWILVKDEISWIFFQLNGFARCQNFIEGYFKIPLYKKRLFIHDHFCIVSKI